MDAAPNNASDPLMDGLLGDFLDESTSLLHVLNADLLQLDDLIKASPSPLDPVANLELLNEMFRAAHSIKGLAGMMRLRNINGLTHKVENLFDAARNGLLTLTTEIVDLVLQAVDRLEKMIDGLREGQGDEVEYHDILSQIERALNQDATKQTPAKLEAGDPLEQLEQIASAIEIVNHAPLTPADELAAVVDDQDIPQKYIAIFVDEGEQTLDEIAEALVAGAEHADTSVLLTTCHRLKGSAASIGLHRIARVAHRMEDILQDLRGRNAPLTNPLADALLFSVDAVRAYVAGLKHGNVQDELSDAFNELVRVTQRDTQTAPPRIAEDTKADLAKQMFAARAAAPAGAAGFLGRISFEQGLGLVELKARLALERLHQRGQLFYCHPSEEELERACSFEHLIFGIISDVPTELIRADLQIQGMLSTELEPIVAAQTTEAVVVASPSATIVTAEPSSKNPQNVDPTPAVANGANAKNKPSETLRVDIDRLDQLMGLAGQLVINKARFTQIGTRLKELTGFKSTLNCITAACETAQRMSTMFQESRDFAGVKDAGVMRAMSASLCTDLELLRKEIGQVASVRSTVNELNEALHQLNRVSDGIQSTVMDTRMVPIGPLFTRFKRVVRDLSRDNQKQIELQINGEGTELDKRMIDELGDPLIHLIRNSADHGIELPDDRVKAGKPRHGTITLNAFQRGNRIVIQIADDGRGLNVERIRDKALSKGLITSAEAERMSNQELYRLIWKPGFSTAERITEVSGRGMGMDIVQSKIEQLNGIVDVVSEPGAGTRFEIKLPLTMAIVPSLLTVVNKDVFAIPVESILEIVQIPAGGLSTVQGKLTARVRDRIISVVELHELFAWKASEPCGSANRSVVTLVIVGSDGNELALTVDELLGEQDVVIKSLEENFQNIAGLAGASILGDGSVSLILDIQALLGMARLQCDAGESFPAMPSLEKVASLAVSTAL